MAIIVHLLLTLGFGAAGLIFMGGFWGAVFGLIFGLMEAAILCSRQVKDGEMPEIRRSKDYEIWGSKDMEPALIVLLSFPTLLCGILLGKIAGGFGWVMLGLLIGLLFGFIIFMIYYYGPGKLFAALFLLFVPAGIFLGIVFPFFGSHWLNGLLGAAAGGLASFLLNSPHALWIKAKRKRKLLEEIAEKERLEEYERNRPITEKLAELEANAQEAYQNNLAELKEAKKEFSEIKWDFDKGFEKYINNPDRYSAYETSFGAVFDPNSGVTDAQIQAATIQGIATCFARRYRVSAAKAKLENDIYTNNRKKALLFYERLNDIYNKLTKAQQERKIEDTAQTLMIGSLSVKIPSHLPNVDALTARLSDASKHELIEYAQNFGKFISETNLTSGTGALVYLAGGILMKGFSNYENNAKIKEKLLKRQIKLEKKIPKLEEGRLQADGFSKRAAELNRALEGTMNAYEKMFVEIYNTLYPPGDESKSKEAREKNKKNGGTYFNEDEVDGVIYLKKTGQFLLELVDTKF